MCENEIKEVISRRETTLGACKTFVRTEEVSLAGACAGAIMAPGTERVEGRRDIA